MAGSADIFNKGFVMSSNLVDFVIGFSRACALETTRVTMVVVIRITLGWVIDRSFTPIAQ